VLELRPCDPDRDGELIRSLTRANFYEAMQATWDEARHQREPLHPERYWIVKQGDDVVGFFALRDEDDTLYVQTIQLVPAARGRGLGTQLMKHVHTLAAERDKRAVRLRVLRSNEAAQRLYARLGYVAISEDDTAFVLERPR